MRYYPIIIVFLLALFGLCRDAHSNSIFSQNTTIAPPETGLFLDYVGVYTPSQAIIHNSAIFPMTTATCHFIPLSAAEKIPACNVTGKREKRAVPIVIAVGVGAVLLGMSLSNMIQTSNLNREVILVERSLSTLSQTMRIHGAYLAKVESKQIELAEELQRTQNALSAMAPILNAHAKAITDLIAGYKKLRIEIQDSFLHLAITDILHNKPTLTYLSPDDLYKVVYDVIERGNLTFNSQQASLPLIYIITKLLVRQQIDFIPSSTYTAEDSNEIGRLVITNYFAVPQRRQTPFYVYKLLIIPFFHENETIQLAHMPHYWAINPKDNTTIEWRDREESRCELQLMTTCRDTPPFRTISKDSCFDQIVGGHTLTKCQTVPIPRDSFFLRQLRDNFWITSSQKPMHCLRAPSSEISSATQLLWSMTEEIILPPLALVNITPEYTLACPGFLLKGLPIVSNVSSLVILYNRTLLNTNVSVFDITQYINNNGTLSQRALSGQEINNLMNFIRGTSNIPIKNTSLSVNMWSYIIFVFGFISLAITTGLLYRAFRRKGENNLQNI